MENLIFVIICLLFIFVVCINGVLLRLWLLYRKKQISEFDKNYVKLTDIEKRLDSTESLTVATYNNSIRIAKKLNVFYCLDKNNYENHKNKQHNTSA